MNQKKLNVIQNKDDYLYLLFHKFQNKIIRKDS